MGFIETYFDPYRRLIYDGIEATLTRKAIHTCALALSVYTEIMGGFVSGNLREDKQSRNNYDAFLPFLGTSYVEANKQLISRKTYLHKEVRSKLVHEFTPRSLHSFQFNDPISDKAGIEYAAYGDPPVQEVRGGVPTLMVQPQRHLIFRVREYYRDFQKAVDNYRPKLDDQNGDRRLLVNFIKAISLKVGE
jgi:hypothetical protein